MDFLELFWQVPVPASLQPYGRLKTRIHKDSDQLQYTGKQLSFVKQVWKAFELTMQGKGYLYILNYFAK